MSHGSDDEMSAIAWPGYVDILSTSLITFVFFTMLLAVALYLHTMEFISKTKTETELIIEEERREAREMAMQEMSQTPVSATAKQTKDQTDQIEQQQQPSQQAPTETKTIEEMEKEELQEQAMQLAAKIEQLEQKQEVMEKVVSDYQQKLVQAQAEFTESEEQKFSQAGKTFTVFFGTDSISVTEETLTALEEFIKAKGGAGIKARIEAGKNADTSVELVARRVAVARLFNLRNVFLKNQVPAADISIKVVPDEQVDESYHWARIVIE